MTDRTQIILQQEKILREGDNLAEQGRFEDAIVKYNEALTPTYIISDQAAAGPMGSLLRVYRHLGDYEKAKQYLQWYLDRNPAAHMVIDQKMELEALLKEKETGSTEPVYEFIAYLKDKYETSLPPNNLNSFTAIVASKIISLYDHISDYDKGIEFADRVLAHPELTEKTRQEYQKIKVAFEEDKAKGTKGSPTNALIQSDYFPW